MIYVTNINLNKNELQNAVIHPSVQAPTNPKLGQLYYNSVDKLMYQYNGSLWKPVGVLYNESSADGKILSGLSSDGQVYTAQVKNLKLVGYTPVEDGYVAANDTLEKAIQSLDDAIKKAVAGGGEVNQYAWSYIHVGSITISATSKTDTLNLSAGNYITLSPDAGNKTVTIGATIPNSSSSEAGLMTSTQYTKLNNIESGAQVNVQADWDALSGDAFIKNKPTALSAFTNDEGFIDNTVNNLLNYYTTANTYTKTEVNTLIGQLATIQVQVVQTLPATGKSNIIYLVLKSSGSSTQNIYDEYLWVESESKFEKVGSTEIDLSNYLQKTGEGKDVTVAFADASSRTALTSGETLAILIGKISKALKDLSDVAYSGSYDDLTDTPTSLVKYKTGTLTAGLTSASVAFSGTLVNASAKDASTGEVIITDIDVSSVNVTFTLAEAWPNNLTLTVMYSD